MKNPNYTSIHKLINDQSEDHKHILIVMRTLFLKQSGIVETIKRNCLHYTFPNGIWCYINARKKKYPILGVSRGARMVKNQPVLGTLFDEVKKVVGKIHLTDSEIIEKKALATFFDRIAELPSGIGVI